MKWSKENLPSIAKGRNWSDEQIEAFCNAANHIFENSKDEAAAIDAGLSMAEKQNGQSQLPDFYYVRHMQAGVCRYADEDVLVDTEAMKKINSTGPGNAVYIQHKTNVPIDAQKQLAGGYITEAFYNELDGWAWFKIMVIDDEMRSVIRQKWAASNAYRPAQSGAGGTKNNLPYRREILDGKITHLAIVPNPRYEKACIMTPDEFKAYQAALKAKLDELHNSNPSPPPPKGSSMFKFFRRKDEEVQNADDATHVQLKDGTFMTTEELANGKKGKNNEPGNALPIESQMVEVNGEKVSVKDLMNSHCALKKNEVDAAAKAEEDKKKKEDEEKENALKADEAKKKTDADAAAAAKVEEERKNGFFDQLVNARENKDPNHVQTIETSISQVARGQARYGSAAIKK